MEGFNKQVLRLKNSIQAIAIELGDALVPVLKVVGKGLEFLCDHMELTKFVAMSLLTTFAAFKVFVTVRAAIDMLSKSIKACTVMQTAWNFVLNANPIIRFITITLAAAASVWGLVMAFRVFRKENKDTNIKAPDVEKPKKHTLETTYSTGGAALVGEYGPELINLKRGDTVTPADKTRQILTSKPVTVNVNIAGNLIGNNEFIQSLKNMLALELKTALATV